MIVIQKKGTHSFLEGCLKRFNGFCQDRSVDLQSAQ